MKKSNNKEKKEPELFSDTVAITCYGETKEWYRPEAIDYFSNAVLNCEGSEKDRYAKILAMLCQGENECSDE